MKIKLDENLPIELKDLLAARNHDVHTVQQESLVGERDVVIFSAAQAEDRLLMTLDLDFADVRQFKPGSHAGVVLIRLRDPSRRRILDRMSQIMDLTPIDSWSRCFIVISDRKLRIRRP